MHNSQLLATAFFAVFDCALSITPLTIDTVSQSIARATAKRIISIKLISGDKGTYFFRQKNIKAYFICSFVKIALSLHSNLDNKNFKRMKTKHVQYETWGTCSKMIDVTADENDVIQQVFFLGGCNGNLQGVSQLVRGQKIDDVIKRLDPAQTSFAGPLKN